MSRRHLSSDRLALFTNRDAHLSFGWKMEQATVSANENCNDNKIY